MFFGEYTYLTDKKKGIPIPPKFLKELGGVGAEVIVAKCSDGCIYLCPSENWAKVKKELDESPYTEVIQINSKGKISSSERRESSFLGKSNCDHQRRLFSFSD